jgi:transmembrane sensor
MTNEPHDISSDLLALYLTGEADATQRRSVEEWAAASDANAVELLRMQQVWDLGSEGVALPDVDVDAAWTKVEGRIADAEGQGRVRSIGRSTGWQRWMAAAAVLTGLVFAARWFFQPKMESYAATSEFVEVLLADNSRSVVSPGSSLDVRMGKQRSVQLSGAAYFEVQRDEERPFIVESGDVLVTVLGTAFEVSAYDTAQAIVVRVRSGRVRVDVAGESVELTAGEHAVYNKERHMLERKPAPPAEAWGLRILQFEGASLEQVADQLQRIYKVRIDLRNEAIARCTLTAEFDDETLKTILGVIAETFTLEVQEQDGTYILDGDGC